MNSYPHWRNTLNRERNTPNPGLKEIPQSHAAKERTFTITNPKVYEKTQHSKEQSAEAGSEIPGTGYKIRVQ